MLESRRPGEDKCYLVQSAFTYNPQGQFCPEPSLSRNKPAGLCQATCLAARQQLKPTVRLHKAGLVVKGEMVKSHISYSLLTFLGLGPGLGSCETSTADVSMHLGGHPSDFRGF